MSATHPQSDRPPRSEHPRDRFDLHVHTSHSDGVCSPAEVVRAASAVGLAGLAITDHDTLTALPAAQAEARLVGLELIPGVELTVTHASKEYHLLAYGFDDQNQGLRDALENGKRSRVERAAEIAERLTRLGLNVDLQALQATWPRASLNRRHFAEWLVRTRQAPSHAEVFARWLGDHAPAFVPKPGLAFEDAVNLVAMAGGVCALAHPPRWLKDETVRVFQAAGMVGIEVEWPRLGRKQVDQGMQRAARLGLAPIAGSDFHAPGKPGAWVGSITTSAAELAQLRKAAPNNQRMLV